MDKAELKRRVNTRIDADDNYAQQWEQGLEKKDESFIKKLIMMVVGAAIPHIMEWVKEVIVGYWERKRA